MNHIYTGTLTISEKLIIDEISEKEQFTTNELGFMFTTIRDNCTKDEHTQLYLQLLIDLIYDKYH